LPERNFASASGASFPEARSGSEGWEESDVRRLAKGMAPFREAVRPVTERARSLQSTTFNSSDTTKHMSGIMSMILCRVALSDFIERQF
jgi:hypothetical protein